MSRFDGHHFAIKSGHLVVGVTHCFHQIWTFGRGRNALLQNDVYRHNFLCYHVLRPRPIVYFRFQRRFLTSNHLLRPRPIVYFRFQRRVLTSNLDICKKLCRYTSFWSSALRPRNLESVDTDLISKVHFDIKTGRQIVRFWKHKMTQSTTKVRQNAVYISIPRIPKGNPHEAYWGICPSRLANALGI